MHHKSNKLFSSLVFALLLYFCGNHSLNAQKFKGGLFGGLISSQVNGDNLSGFDIFGIHAGAFTTLNLSERGHLQFEIGLSQKGAQERDSSTSNFYRLRINYVSIPLLYTYRLNKQLSFEVGPQADLFVNFTEEDIAGERQNNPYPFYPVNLAGVGGIVYHISDNFWICFRSSISITPTRKNTRAGGAPYIIQAGGAGHRNLALSTALYYQF